MTKKDNIRRLSRTKFKPFKDKIFGFDIETSNNNKEFLLASIYSENYLKYFYTADEVRDEILKNPIFRDCVIFASNLSFDFFGTFYRNCLDKFFMINIGSRIIMAKTHYYKGDFHFKPKIKSKTLKSIMFLDSMNYAFISVEKMGNIIGMSKFTKPEFLGNVPETEEQWNILKEYNLRDSQITYHFMKYLINGFEQLGATFKYTIASTSMSLFRNRYLNDTYYLPSKDVLQEQFYSYYGGRTEAFSRGYIKDYNYYDVNSLYPFVMHENEYPDPNSLHITCIEDIRHIELYHGISNIEIFVPHDLKYPLLPFRSNDGRVLFPTGTISGWYTHIEIRKALELGCKIIKIRKTHYYTKTCRPFHDFVNNLYNLRKRYKEDKSPMEFIIKLCLNSLYGKFGQKFIGKEEWRHVSCFTLEDMDKYPDFSIHGDFVRIVKDSEPALFCIPIWASYITSYARLHLYDLITKNNAIYCDTDSIITKNEISTSNDLGALKKEMIISEGVIVRPKFYAVVSADDTQFVKIKGLGLRLSYYEFIGLLNEPFMKYDKFAKFKEAIKRGFIPNEIIEVHKEFSLEDEKRVWPYPFSNDTFQESKPIDIDTHIFSKQKILYEKYVKKLENAKISEYIKDDNFDRESVGSDISYEEFLKNEMDFERLP